MWLQGQGLELAQIQLIFSLASGVLAGLREDYFMSVQYPSERRKLEQAAWTLSKDLQALSICVSEFQNASELPEKTWSKSIADQAGSTSRVVGHHVTGCSAISHAT